MPRCSIRGTSGCSPRCRRWMLLIHAERRTLPPTASMLRSRILFARSAVGNRRGHSLRMSLSRRPVFTGLLDFAAGDSTAILPDVGRVRLLLRRPAGLDRPRPAPKPAFRPFGWAVDIEMMLGQYAKQIPPYSHLEDLSAWLAIYVSEMGIPMILAVIGGMVFCSRRLRPNYISAFSARLMVGSTILFASLCPLVADVPLLPHVVRAAILLRALRAAVHRTSELRELPRDRCTRVCRRVPAACLRLHSYRRSCARRRSMPPSRAMAKP